jgi:transcriptional regulator with XRE-family HTH domain
MEAHREAIRMIGDRIRERRIELNMTQEELAKKLGYKSRASINKIELGQTDITQSRIVEFARALDTTPAYLMGWEKPVPAASPIDTYDEEILADLQRLHDDPDLRMLLSATRKLSREDIRVMADLARRMHSED